MSKRKNHPYADLFPMMTEAELEALSEDIKEHGLRHPIVLYQGQVLDGRNRLLACEKAGVEPTFTEFEGDEDAALALVVSLNVQRRDLTPGQRALSAARRWGLDEKRNGRPTKEKTVQSKPISLDAVSREFKSAKVTITQARDLLVEAPDLALLVDSTAVSLRDAYDQLQRRRKEADQKARDAAKVSEYADAISAGEMKLEEALQKAIEQEREAEAKAASLADARRTWLKGLAELVRWLEVFVATADDDKLAWYAEPGSPGNFDHGVTAERVASAVEQMERIYAHTFGGKRGRKKS